MKITIKKINIPDNPTNEVTHSDPFGRRKINKKGELVFHPDGIFSDRIFGKFSKCKCGELTKPGICEKCGTRVISKKSMPDFYIKFPNIDIPAVSIDYGPYLKQKKQIDGIMYYKGFVYEGKYYDNDLLKLDLTTFDMDKVLIGKDAILALGIDEEWYNSQVSDKIYVPHPSMRKITRSGDKIFLGEMNTALLAILNSKRLITEANKDRERDIFTDLSEKQLLMEEISNFYSEMFKILASNHRSIIKREVRAQTITGAARGVLTNNPSLDEDIIVLGKYFIPILYPSFVEPFTDEEGKMDIKALNQYLIDNKYRVLVNRPPTIGEKSFMGFIPEFSELDAEKYVIQMNSITFDGFAADTDGDCVLVIALYTKAACEEADEILPSKNYIGGADGKVRNKIVEDYMYTMKKSYEDKTDLAWQINKLLGKPNMTFEEAVKELDNVDRDVYIEVNNLIAENQFSYCIIPTVGDFAEVVGKKLSTSKQSRAKIEQLSEFTGNTDEIWESCAKRTNDYTESESDKFIRKVMAANIDEITQSGYFYKKLMSSCDNMRISKRNNDCGSEGQEMLVKDIDETTFEYKVKNHYVMEFNDYIETWEEFKKYIEGLETVHVRNFLTCQHSKDKRSFCRKCAGTYKRSKNWRFVPYNIGVYSTLMITEHATQDSLDSMNVGVKRSVNKVIETRLPNKFNSYEEVKEQIEKLIDEIGYVGVQSRYYEIALLSRFYRRGEIFDCKPLVTSFSKQGDKLGIFIYQPTEANFRKLLLSEETTAKSLKSQVMFDNYK